MKQERSIFHKHDINNYIMLQKIEKREREKLIPHVDKLDSPLMDI